MRHTDPNDFRDSVDTDYTRPPRPIPLTPVEQEVIPEHLRSKESKTKFILIAVALVVAAIWAMTKF